MKKVIGYVCQSNPFTDKKAWSGSIYKIREGIENAGFEVKWIPYKGFFFFNLILKFCYRFSFLNGLVYTRLSFWLYSLSINKKTLQGCDLFFFPGGEQLVEYVNFDKPKIIYGDSTMPLMIDYYWFGISPFIKKMIIQFDKIAHMKSDLIIKSSNWVIKSVVADYGISDDKTAVIEFGCSLNKNKIVPIIPYESGKLRILFSGVDWERKGASIAIDTVRCLNDMGIDAVLYLVGIRLQYIPIEYRNLPFVEYIGFLNKNKVSEAERYTQIYHNSHLLLVPTKAECAGIVFAEASAYGMPTLTHDTGGIESYVVNGINGYRLPLGSTPQQFAVKIKQMIIKKEFGQLGKQAIIYYEKRLNWEIWGERFKKLLEDKKLV